MKQAIKRQFYALALDEERALAALPEAAPEMPSAGGASIPRERSMRRAAS